MEGCGEEDRRVWRSGRKSVEKRMEGCEEVDRRVGRSGQNGVEKRAESWIRGRMKKG